MNLAVSRREAVARPASPAVRVRSERLVLPALLILIDVTAVAIGFALAYVLRFRTGLPVFALEASASPRLYLQVAALLVPVWILVFTCFRLYDLQVVSAGTQEYARVIQATSLAMTMVVFATFMEPDFIIARAWLLLSWLFIALLVTVSRFGFRRVIYALRLRGHLLHPTIIVGACPEGSAIAAQLASAPQSGLQVVGFVDDTLPVSSEVVADLRVIGSTGQLDELVRHRQVTEIIVVPSSITREQLVDIFRAFGTTNGHNVRLASGLFEILTTGMQVREYANVPLLTLNKVRLSGLEMLLKTTLDYVVASLLLILLTPVLLFVALLVRWDSAGPVLYRRRVVGLGGRPFDALKYRTMVQDSDRWLEHDPALLEEYQEHFKIKDDPRVTRVGAWLRRISMDELPQLVNVLRGEMSLVGPRMITQEELARYGKWATNLLTVKPGITGLWQVSGRCELSYEQRIDLDMYYIRNYSIWLDVRLLIQTIPAVLRARGAY